MVRVADDHPALRAGAEVHRRETEPGRRKLQRRQSRKETRGCVAVLGASNPTYAEVTWSQRGPDFIASHVRALDFLDGGPAALVPDQLKSGVTRACRYEPEAQRTYEELARHYGTTVLPARPKRPRDKAKVEVGVQIAQRWIVARMRNEVFHSPGAMNVPIREFLLARVRCAECGELGIDVSIGEAGRGPAQRELVRILRMVLPEDDSKGADLHFDVRTRRGSVHH